MNFLSLKYFLVASEELNFTKAAARLFITQQTLSNHIARLEEDVDAPLFERTNPLTLTLAGQNLVRHATLILNEQEKLLQDISNIKNNYAGQLSVAIAYERASLMLPQILSGFHEKFPNIICHILEGASSQAVEDFVYKGEADCSIGMQIVGNDLITSQILFVEKAVLAVPNSILQRFFIDRGAPIPDPGKPISLYQFANCPFVAFSRNTAYGQNFATQCRNENFVPNVVAQASTSLTTFALCCSGLGILLCPKYITMTQNSTYVLPASEQITLYEFEKEQLDYNICINYFTKKLKHGILKEFVDYTGKYYRAF